MKAIVLVRHGKAENAFEMREVSKPEVGADQVLIKAEGFGLNFADVMARLGQYRDAPPIPAVLGYEAVGRVEHVGANVTHVGPGDRVVAFTRFGGYAEYVSAMGAGVAKVSESLPLAEATALATQYCTAWFAAEEMVRLHTGDRVLVQAAAGGVGTALVQLAKRRGCTVFGTAGSDAKLEYLRKIGVDHAINYNSHDFASEIRRIHGGDALDVVFDSLGGKAFRKGMKLLGGGGRIVGFGAAESTGNGFLGMLKLAWDFGFVHPALLLMSSRAVIGVNMLRIADEKPEVLRRSLAAVCDLAAKGELKPASGGEFNVAEIAKAHEFLESRKSVGKIAVRW